jgi:hypothetical protein
VPSIFSKLNLKDQDPIYVLNAPASFEIEINALENVEVIRKVTSGDRVTFGVAFAITQEELDTASTRLTQAADGDAILWLAYPKGTSRKYRCEFNRDAGWGVLGAAGFEGVRQVAIDEDWSALRFRRVDFIKSFTRAPERASTSVGKERARR